MAHFVVVSIFDLLPSMAQIEIFYNKIHFKENEIYIYLLIEFQSTVDQFMAIRINRYLAEFYEFLSHVVTGNEIPAAFPVMLYNGKDKWTACTKIQDLIRSSIPDKYIPHFSYFTIIENEIPKEVLLRIENAVSAIFYIENSRPEDLKKECHTIIKLIEKEDPGIILLFRRWLNNLFQTSKEEWEKDDINEHIDNLLEVKVMFETALKERDKKMIEQGIEQNTLKLAKKMKNLGYSLEEIAKITGLTTREIETL
jgi:predicted transposase/invertase (TIGR01784 family)